MVTGASDGIGKEYAAQLAAAGFNVVLLARNEAKLAAVKDEIERESGARRCHVASRSRALTPPHRRQGARRAVRPGAGRRQRL